MAHGLVAAVGEPLARAGRILEIGCGTGYLTGLIRQANREARLVALDLDAALVAAARRRLGPEAGVAWLVADGETLIRGEYDLIIANATFQWFTRPGETLAALLPELGPRGRPGLLHPGAPNLSGTGRGPEPGRPEPEPRPPSRRFPPRGLATGRPGPTAYIGPDSARSGWPGKWSPPPSPR